MSTTAVILAGGASKRMKSKRSKVLHRLAGRPLLHYPVLAAAGAGAQQVVVVASPSNRDDVEACLRQLPKDGLGSSDLGSIDWRIAVQEVARGTGDAARAAMPAVEGQQLMILCGDTPLIEADALRGLVASAKKGRLSMLYCELDDPTGYGRLLRSDDGGVVAIREQKDLEPGQVSIREVNAGMYLGSVEFFQEALAALKADNAQSEYYLTDVVAFAANNRAGGASAVQAISADPAVLQGINDRVQFNRLEQALYRRIADRHRRCGVSVREGAEIDDTVSIGQDTTVASGVSLRGNTRIGEDCEIDQGCVLTDAELESGVRLKPYSVVSQSCIDVGAEVGPFVQLRPGTHVGQNAKVGNFVELKKASLGVGAKANHLSYLGDASVGDGANIGAGTIVCNYDGFSKSHTEIGARAFVGSNSKLIAPVRVGEGAYVATGTTVTEDVPDDGLAIARARQITKPNYAPGLRAKLKARADRKA